jgi:hypothetical protein
MLDMDIGICYTVIMARVLQGTLIRRDRKMDTYTCKQCGAVAETNDEDILALSLCHDCLDYPTDDNSFEMEPLD